jgi:UDP-glucuronate 4-epimerase
MTDGATDVLVTGGAGFIGSHLVDRLLTRGAGARVTVIDNFNSFYDPAVKRLNVAHHLGNRDFELIEADICDTQAIDQVFARHNFDCVVHLAARAGVRASLDDPVSYVETNVRGAYVLLEACRRHAVPRFIFGSSSSVYGIGARVPFSEAEALSTPASPYAATKIAAEAACHVYSHLYGMRIVCLRFFTAYGARQRPDLAIHKFARLISQGRPIPVYGDGTSQRDYTYIDDIVSGITSAMQFEGSPFEVFNLGESRTVELRRLVEFLEEVLGKRAEVDWQPAQPGDLQLTHADISKARRLLGYAPQTDIEAGLREFAAWFRGTDSSL